MHSVAYVEQRCHLQTPVKPLTEMSPEELRVEINLLRERRLIVRQQAIEENKPKPRKPRSTGTGTGTGEEVDSEIGSLMDSLMDGGISDENLDIMMKNLGEL